MNIFFHSKKNCFVNECNNLISYKFKYMFVKHLYKFNLKKKFKLSTNPVIYGRFAKSNLILKYAKNVTKLLLTKRKKKKK